MEWQAHPRWHEGLTLFNAGKPWEAHEAWEAVWKEAAAAGDVSVASFVQGLIWCAAAWVKRRAGEPRGASIHAGRVADRMAALRPVTGGVLLGVALDEVVRIAEMAADGGPADAPVPPIIPVG